MPPPLASGHRLFVGFTVPDRFNRNAPDVRAMGSPADTGAALISYMCERVGARDLTEFDVLDFGCGSRFADAIVNRRLPVKSYVGIDVHREMIEFLSGHVPDSRLSFFHLDARNPKYNPTGTPLTVDSRLPIGDRRFDLICMFSVVTHQVPDDAGAIFSILRRHVREPGSLFFSAYLREGGPSYEEHDPERPTALSIYSLDLMRSLLKDAGWRIVTVEPQSPRGLPILDSIVCAPA